MAKRFSLDEAQKRRAFLVLGLQGALVLGLGSRFAWLQGLDNQRYYTRAEGNRINVEVVIPRRGVIQDRNKVALAVDSDRYQSLLIPEQVESIDEALRRYSLIVPLSQATINRIKKDIRENAKFIPVSVSNNLSWDVFAKLNIRKLDLAGIMLERGFKRYYPFKGLTSHTLGYVGAVTKQEIDLKDRLTQQPGFYVGRRGLELQFDQSLRGLGGSRAVEVNALGRVIKVLEERQGQQGDKVTVSFDIRVQQFLAKQLAPYRRGAGVIMDTKTGGVIAMVSQPSFDPNKLAVGIDSDSWKQLEQHPDHPLHNRAISGQYSPGSTFKVVSLLAGLEAGVAQTMKVSCRGSIYFGNRTYHCWRKAGHGSMSYLPAFEQSCDVWYYRLAQAVGLEKMVSVAKRLGLGEKTGINMPGEATGLVPTRAWKKKKLNDAWRDGDSLIAYIGQGFLLCTPLQLTTMMARIATGKKVTPSLTFTESANFEDLDIDPEYLAMVREALFAAVYGKKATGYLARVEEKYAIAGKTGTSQVKKITAAERKEGNAGNKGKLWEHRDHALFISMAPYSNPRFAASVVVEHEGSGGVISAPICAKVLRYAQAINQGEKT